MAKQRKIGGRTVAAAKAKVLEAHPNASPEEKADAFNKLMAAEGHSYRIDADRVKRKWGTARRAAKIKRTKRVPSRNGTPSSEGEATRVLQDLVRLLGRDATKRLVDSI
jgi:hypothetical protein